MKTLSQALGPSLRQTTTPASSPPTIADPRIELDAYNASLASLHRAASLFLAEMEAGGHPRRWLTLSGVPGCGKTFVASQVFRLGAEANPGGKGIWLGSRPRPASVWLSASEFGQRMKSGDWSLPESLANEWLVAIDDLGAEHDKSGFLADALYRACNARLGKWTIFTTNFTLGEIADRLDQRIASRLIRDGNEVFSIDAEDYAGR